MSARRSVGQRRQSRAAPCSSRRTAAKLVAILHGVLEEARTEYGLTGNPARDVARWKLDYQATALEFPFYEPEQVSGLARRCESSGSVRPDEEAI